MSTEALEVKRRPRHGLWKQFTAEHQVWTAMLQRCSNPNDKDFQNYGGRGIKVCDRWQSFPNFMADLGPRPSSSHSLDRRNNDKGYEASNCHWVTRKEQNSNKRTTKRITHDGQTLTLKEWAPIVGIDYWTLRSRYDKGWTAAEILAPIWSVR